MATTSPPPPSASTTTQRPALDSSSRAAVIHNISWGALIACPILIALPPRKLDVYTLALLSGTFMGGNQLTHEYTGRSIVTRMQNRLQKMSEPKFPTDRAREVSARMREERERKQGKSVVPVLVRGSPVEEDRRPVLDEVQRNKERGVMEKVWMGGEGEDWKQKRDQREKEALEEGRGYGGLIMDQIWEVWNWGKEKSAELKEIDEEIVKEEKKGKR